MKKRNYVILASALLTLVLAVWLVHGCRGRHEAEPAAADSLPALEQKPDLAMVRNCADLEAAEFRFHKIIVVHDQHKLLTVNNRDILPSVERTMVLPTDITVVGRVDCSQITEQHLWQQGDSLVLELPDPVLQVMSVTADHRAADRTSQQQWYRGGRFDDRQRTRFMRQAIDSMMVDRNMQMMVRRTRENAATVLIPLIAEATGLPQANIRVCYRSDFDYRQATVLSQQGTIIKRRD